MSMSKFCLNCELPENMCECTEFYFKLQVDQFVGFLGRRPRFEYLGQENQLVLKKDFKSSGCKCCGFVFCPDLIDEGKELIETLTPIIEELVIALG